MDSHPRSWCSKKLEFIGLGDERLNRRLLMVADDLLHSPEKPIHAATKTQPATKSAYRLVRNKRFQGEIPR